MKPRRQESSRNAKDLTNRKQAESNSDLVTGQNPGTGNVAEKFETNGPLTRFIPPYMDYLLTTAECASWLKIAEETLSIQVNNGEIPSIDLNRRVRRFHARSVLLALRAEPTSLIFPESAGILDAFLTTPECAGWFQMNVKTFRSYVHAKKISAQGTNERFWRFHPRTVLTNLGVKPKALPSPLPRAA